MEQRRILIDASAAFQQLGGIARYQRGLIGGLRRVRPDLALELCADQAPGVTTPPALEGLPVHWLPGGNKARRLRDLLSHRLPLPVAIDHTGARLFHATDFTAPRLVSTPTVVTVCDTTPITHPALHQPLHRAHLRLAIPLTCRQAARVICISETTRRDLVSLLPEVQDRVEVISLGVEPRFVPRSAEAVARVRRTYRLPERYLLTVGTVEPRKGHLILVELARLLRTVMPDSPPIYIAGPIGWKAGPLLAAVERSPARGLVRLLGPVSEANLPALYSGATAFLFPSLYEGFGLPVVEAMACGIPVVASRTAGVTEAVGEAGLLAPPGDARAFAQAVATVLTVPEVQSRLRARGLAWARRFDWDDTARRTAAIYDEVLDQQQGVTTARH